MNTNGRGGGGENDMGGSDGGSAGEAAAVPHALEQPLAPVQTESHVAAQISFILLTCENPGGGTHVDAAPTNACSC